MNRFTKDLDMLTSSEGYSTTDHIRRLTKMSKTHENMKVLMETAIERNKCNVSVHDHIASEDIYHGKNLVDEV